MTRIGDTWELEPQCARRVQIEGHAPIALVRLEDGFFALEDTCTHGAASLADGDIADGQVECPFHAGAFDIRTGEATRFPCTRALRTYRVEVRGDEIFADLGTQPAT